jgi:hypothetical protein
MAEAMKMEVGRLSDRDSAEAEALYRAPGQGVERLATAE